MDIPQRPALVRLIGDRFIAGVCAGVADHFGWDRRVVRSVTAVLALTGFGIVLYALAMALLPGSDGSEPFAVRIKPRDWLDLAAYAAIAIGVIQLLGELASNFTSLVIAIVVLATLSVAVVLSWPTDTNALLPLPSWVPRALVEAVGELRQQRGLLARALVGGVLTIVGAAVLLAGSSSLRQLVDGLLGLSVLLVGVLMIVGPLLGRLGVELIGERRARIRTEERAEIGAHLHDSVLQTLALIQRRADDPREIVRLARKQERELRSWLLTGDVGPAHADSFASALTAIAAELEELHGVRVELVTVRDCQVDESVHAMLLATREAILNAQRHASVDTVSVFGEVDATEARVYVRDRGVGFDRMAVAADRGGVAESIEGRMRRHGGQCSIRSTIGEGTEVALAMPHVTTAAAASASDATEGGQ
jgi:signal transduction histidine kinase